MLTFTEFMAHRESTAAKRAKTASLLGLAAPIAEPNINSGATADPRLVDYYEKNVKKKNKKKAKPKPKPKKKGKKMSKLRESFGDKPTPPINHGVDSWLDSVDKLKKGLKHPADEAPPDDEDDELGDDEDMPDEDMPDDEDGDESDHPLDEPFDDEEGDEPPPDEESPPTDLGKPPMKNPLLGGNKFGTPSKSVPSFREWVQYREKKQR